MFLISIQSKNFLTCRLFVRLSSCLSVYWLVCHSANLSSAPIFLLQSFLSFLSVAVLPNSMSACCLACLSFFCELVVLLLSCLPLFLPAILPVWLSVTTLVHPSIGLSVFLPVCCLLPSFCYSPSVLSCLLLSCLPVLPVCLSFVNLLSCCCPAYPYFCLPSWLSDFLWRRLFVCQSTVRPLIGLSVFLLVCRLLPYLSVTVSPFCLVCCCPAE